MLLRLTGNLEANVNKANGFCTKHPKGTIFQALGMFEVYKKTKNYYPIYLAVEDDSKNIVGVLLAVIQKEHEGILGKFSARSIIIGGPLVKDNNPKIIEFLLKEYNKEIKGKAIYTQIRNHWEWDINKKAIFKKSGYIYEPHLDIIHDLTIPIDKQFMSLHKGRRKNIRRAEKADVKFREIQTVSEFEKSYELIQDTYKRVRLPMPDKSLFSKSYVTLTKNNILKVFVAIFEEKIIGTRMVLCYNSLVYDWYAGASNNHLDKYPNDFLPWKVIEWGSENGYKYFDFGGAGKPDIPYGVRDHKLKFGGKLVEHGRFEKIHNRLLFQAGKIGLKIYKKVK